ncbi:MAG: hypothetical protein BWK73_10430 [Thiothrix lacustris]|uniref:Uncharacterized protein n=1 Tax=Thiothrix lacustris TaxID=525917 RepID=A0A1Y1QUH4_9GAMM|nr:MAG: hypothetical protein BWK73_10430 [Thiothrix lacustris]
MDTTKEDREYKQDSGAEYVPPTSAEVRAILHKMGLTGEMAGELVACSSRQIRRYTAEGRDKSSMPYAILYTLAHKHSGCALTPKNWRNELVIQPKDAADLIGVKW